jgi:Ni/Fe-hydrogenase 1 B-type cytochrome subunit
MAFPVLAPVGEPFDKFIMGTVRQIHFTTGFIYTLNFLWRIYWFWMGNNYARSGFPFVWRKSWWADLKRQMLDYLKLHRGHVHLGHNALGGLTYTLFVIALGWAQIVSGFALYSESDPAGFWASILGWCILIVGGSFQLHMWHHLMAWGFVVFTILHIYIIFYDGQQYKNGLVTSMVSGYKFYQEGDFDHDTWIS